MKQLNLNLNKTLSPNSNIVLSSQQAIKSYVDSKKVFVQFLQESVPTTFKAGDKWVNTASNKLFIATNDTTWDNGSNLDTTAIYSFGNLLYHYNGTDIKCYSTTSITEQNANKEIKEWFGTQDEYNAIETKDENTHYIIIDDASTSSSLLATQEEFNNSVTDKAATPKQVNEKIGNYLPLAGGNLDGGAILRFTNTNNQVSSMSLDENKYITMSDNLKVSGDINTNSLVSTTGNIYKGNSSGATNIWSDSFATAEKAGIIKVGNNLTIAEDGTLNAEAGGGSGFDFEGTKAEFDAAVAAGTITEDSVSLITDDVSGDNVATKADLAATLNERADKQLSNTNLITNCILSAPNGVLSMSDTTITIHKGLKVALTNGYNADGTPRSEIYTLSDDIIKTTTSPTIGTLYIFLAKSVKDDSVRALTTNLYNLSFSQFFPTDVAPTQGYVAYEISSNYVKFQVYDGTSTTIESFKGALLGKVTRSGGKNTNLEVFSPIQLNLNGLGDYVVESRVKTDSWYRKYKSGWLEQGGTGKLENAIIEITLPKQFITTNYTLLVSPNEAAGGWPIAYGTSKTATSFYVDATGKALQTQRNIAFSWEAKGMGAN